MVQAGQPKLACRRRIGVIGDIHTEHEVLAWALRTLREREVELVLATGDIADGPQHEAGVARCCELLRAGGAHVVSGNHDRWLLDGEMRHLPDAGLVAEIDDVARDYLRGLPASIEIETPLGLLLFGHGLGNDDMATLYPHDHGAALTDNTVLQSLLAEHRYKLMCSGHTHRRMVRVVEGVTMINAGTLLQRRDPCCLVLDFEARQARFLDYAPNGATTAGPEFPL